jgi:hypothetical protein
MQFTSSSPIPGLPSRPLPVPDLGVLGRSSRVRTTVGKALEGAYVMGAADGFAVGQSVGQVTGHVAGIAEGVAISTVAWAIVVYVAFMMLKAMKAANASRPPAR